MGWKRYIVVSALAAASICAAGAEIRAVEPLRDSDGQSEPGLKKPNADEPTRKFVRGPLLMSSDKFRAWFERQIKSKETSYFRAPLVLEQGQVGFSLRGARIGSASDAIKVNVNDSALGNGLASHAATYCKGRQTCALWVEGHMVSEGGGDFRFDVMKFCSPIGADALASADYVEIEEKDQK